MPANLDTEIRMRAQIAANPQPGTLFGRIILRIVSTGRGWLVRQALKLASVASTALTTWLVSKFILVEQFAAQQGVSHDTLQDLHNAGVSLMDIIASLIATFALGTTEAILSRMAAKISEVPIIPVAPPVDPEPKPPTHPRK